MEILSCIKNFFRPVEEVIVVQISPDQNRHIVKQGKTTLVGLLEKNTAFIFSDKDIIYIKVDDFHTGKPFSRTICVRYKIGEEKLSVVVIDASSRVRPLVEDISFNVKAKGHAIVKKA